MASENGAALSALVAAGQTWPNPSPLSSDLAAVRVTESDNDPASARQKGSLELPWSLTPTTDDLADALLAGSQNGDFPDGGSASASPIDDASIQADTALGSGLTADELRQASPTLQLAGDFTCNLCHGSAPPSPPPTYCAWLPCLPNAGPIPRSPTKTNPPQCGVQYDNDSVVRGRRKTRTCWESASERLSYCNRTGEVGLPTLRP